MSQEPMIPQFTQRHEDGDFTIEILAYVTNSYVSVHFASPEHEAEFNFDNRLGLNVAEANLHPSLIAAFIEQAIGDGEVKYHFVRRPDILTKDLSRHPSRGKRGQR